MDLDEIASHWDVTSFVLEVLRMRFILEPKISYCKSFNALMEMRSVKVCAKN